MRQSPLVTTSQHPSSNLKPTAPTKPMGLTRSCPLIQSVCLRSRVFSRWVLDVVSVQTPCYQELRHSIYPDFHLIFFDSAWHVGHDMSYGLTLVDGISIIPTLLYGASPRSLGVHLAHAFAEPSASAHPVLCSMGPWDLEVPVSLTGSLVIPTNKIYSTTVVPWKTALFSCDSCQWAITTKTAQHFRLENLKNPSTVEGWSTIRQIWYQRFIGTIGGSHVHMLWTMDV